MLVSNWMSSKLVSIDPEGSLAQATRLLEDYHIGRLPVIDKNGRLVGIISDRDLKRAGASDVSSLEVHELAYLLSRVKVSDIMTPGPLTVGEDATIEEAAQVMLANKISGLPVVDSQGNPVAVITQNDVFRALVLLSGASQGGLQVAMNIADQSGSIKPVADVIRTYGGRIISILTSHERVAKGRRKVYIRVKNLDKNSLNRLGHDLGLLGEVLYLRPERVDRENRAA